MKYEFSENWFTPNDFAPALDLDTNKDTHILEIGSYEGRSTVWFIENLIKTPESTITCIDPWQEYIQHSTSESTYHPSDKRDSIFNRFKSNILKTGKDGNVIVKRGFSYDILKQLALDKKRYDVIFIDGNHTARFVLEDSVLSYSLLNTNGYIVWDDYTWTNPYVESTPQVTPKLGVDSFINCYKDHLKIVHKGNKVVVKKIK
jgi:predicted O-methyltransferase YrrM